VLVHGAWHGAWCWQKLVPLLREKGLVVYTPTQTGVGEKAHLLSTQISVDTFVSDIADFLTEHDLNNVVLVGHSFAGISISGVADRMPERIRRLVYLDSLLLQNGQSVFDIIPSQMVQARREMAQQTSGGISLPAPEPEVLGVTEVQDVQWVKNHCTPHPISTYESKMTLSHALGNGLAATYIAVLPHYSATTASRNYAKTRSDWQYVEIPAGHDAMVTSPLALYELIAPMAQPEAVISPPSLEDRALKYIEGHNREIWIGIAVLVALVVLLK
jgi:pimeloyl-ACP methyl ester carboxylesterase